MIVYMATNTIKNPAYGKPAYNRRKVVAINIETNKVIGCYDSIIECGENLPISHASIKKILSGVFKSIKGIVVQYGELQYVTKKEFVEK